MKPHISTAVWAFVDLLFNVLLVTLYINSLMDIPHPKAAEAKQDGIQPGKLCAELYWPDYLDIDLDLWGRGPSGAIVGYSNRSSVDLDLLRDTLGKHANPGGHNFEMMCSTALTAGQWTFNVHYYRPHQEPVPLNVPVKLVVNFPQEKVFLLKCYRRMPLRLTVLHRPIAHLQRYNLFSLTLFNAARYPPMDLIFLSQVRLR